MKRPLLTLAATTVMVLATACVSDEGGEGDAAEDASPPASEPTETSTEPAVLSYGALTGFETLAEAAGPVLEYEQTEMASFHLEGADPQEAIYVVSYRLDEAPEEWTLEERSVISTAYDGLTANESNGSPLPAIAGGHQAVFRYAVFRDADDKYVYQWNTFVFDGLDVVQVTCQWRNERELIQTGCQDLQTGFSIDRG